MFSLKEIVRSGDSTVRRDLKGHIIRPVSLLFPAASPFIYSCSKCASDSLSPASKEPHSSIFTCSLLTNSGFSHRKPSLHSHSCHLFSSHFTARNLVSIYLSPICLPPTHASTHCSLISGPIIPLKRAPKLNWHFSFLVLLDASTALDIVDRCLLHGKCSSLGFSLPPVFSQTALLQTHPPLLCYSVQIFLKAVSSLCFLPRQFILSTASTTI